MEENLSFLKCACLNLPHLCQAEREKCEEAFHIQQKLENETNNCHLDFRLIKILLSVFSITTCSIILSLAFEYLKCQQALTKG